MKVLDKAAPSDNSVYHLLDVLFRKDSLKVQKRNTIMAAEHVNYADFLFLNFLCPLLKHGSVPVLDGIDEKSRKEEVVGHIPLIRNRLIYLLAVACMDLGKEGYSKLIGKLLNLFKNVPGIGFV